MLYFQLLCGIEMITNALHVCIKGICLCFCTLSWKNSCVCVPRQERYYILYSLCDVKTHNQKLEFVAYIHPLYNDCSPQRGCKHHDHVWVVEAPFSTYFFIALHE